MVVVVVVIVVVVKVVVKDVVKVVVAGYPKNNLKFFSLPQIVFDSKIFLPGNL